MKNQYQHILLLFKRFLFILIIFSLTRFLFWVFNWNYFSTLSTVKTIKAFYHGLAFDVSAICYFNVLFFVLHLIPGNFKNHQKFQFYIKLLFVIINGIILATNIIDIEYFKFIDKRTTFDIFYMGGLSDDLFRLIPKFIIDFWYLVLIWILIVVILWFLYPEKKLLKPEKSPKLSTYDYIYQALIFVLIGTFIFFGGRGSLELKPLRIISAAKYVKSSYIPLVLNTPFSILRTSNSKKNLKSKKYFEPDVLAKIYSPVKHYKTTDFKDNNIVILILESFSSKYIGFMNNGEGYTPFLDSLMNESFVCMHNFANGKKSIEGIPAVLASLPTLMNYPFISSAFSSDNINSIASILKEKGYNATFFHGGSNGTMGFDKFTKLADFDNYYGRTEYNNKKDYDGHWGIFDEEFLQFFASKLNGFKKPFISALFTLSSHHPYPIPEKYKSRFSNTSKPLENSISYTDFALQQFFKTISKTEWFKNTLFVITADHTAGNMEKTTPLNSSTYAIPLIFYNPSDSSLKGKYYETTQQIDILPSILDYLHYNGSFISFGSSVFKDSTNKLAINYINQVYQIVERNYSLLFDGEKTIGFYDISKDTSMIDNLIEKNITKETEMEQMIKAFIQSYNNRMLDNKLIIKN